MRRRWAVLAVATLIGVLIGAGSALAFEEEEAGDGFYKATNTIFLEVNSEGEASFATFTNVDQIAFLVVSGDVPDQVAQNLGEDEGELTSHVLVTANATLSTVEITAAARSAQEAERIADTFSEELVVDIQEKDQAFYNEQRDEIIARSDELAAQIDAIDAQLAAAPNDVVEAQRDALINQYRLTQEQIQVLAVQGAPTNRLSTLETAEAIPIDESEYRERLRRGQIGENLVTISPSAEESGEPTGSGESRLDSPLERGVLGGALGLLLGIGLVLLTDQLDQRLRSRDEAEEAFEWPVLAEVPALTRSQQRRTEVMARAAPLSRAAEAYRAVRTSLLFRRATEQVGVGDDGSGNGSRQGRPKEPDGNDASDTLIVMVASPGPGEGKTTTSANLAAIFAESGSSVLVVNCDFRRPRVHRYLGVEDQPRRILNTDIPGVRLISNVLSSAAANPTTVVDEQRRVVAAARKRFDVVILDTAALLATSDALEMLPAADTVLVVARDGTTSRSAAARTHELLTRLAAPVAGLVFVGAEAAPDSRYYYYSRETSRQVEDVATEGVEATLVDTDSDDEVLVDDVGDLGFEGVDADDAPAGSSPRTTPE